MVGRSALLMTARSYSITLSSERITSMANGDPLLIGIEQPPDNRATSTTLLVHRGSSFGDQRSAFWVQRVDQPLCSATIRGDNFSTGPAGGVTRAGVTGTAEGACEGGGVVARGTA